jgi:pyruvate,orthophosphate dikinase
MDEAILVKKIEAGEYPPHDAIDFAVALAQTGKITPRDAVMMIDPESVVSFQLPVFAEAASVPPLASGLGVSPGCACGIAVFDSEEAMRRSQAGESIILVIDQLRPEQVDALRDVVGVISGEGNASAHASVVSRELGRPAVASWDFAKPAGDGELSLGLEATIKRGQEVSIDGKTGKIFPGRLQVTTHAERPSFKALMKWANAMKGIDVRANADTAPSIARALAFGASGVGLVRTERMFFGERLKWLQCAILAHERLGPEEAKKYFDQLRAVQQSDYEDIFKVAKDVPLTIRLMDPPLHEFLPKLPEGSSNAATPEILAKDLDLPIEKVVEGLSRSFDAWTSVDPERLYVDIHQDSPELTEVSKELELSPTSVRNGVHLLRETNPMIGLRGVRLGIKAPVFYQMQAKALFGALASQRREGSAIVPNILIPMVSSIEEIAVVRALVEDAKKSVERETGAKLAYKLGAMIETPAGALSADKLAQVCDYFSFGTNDLTQCTHGLSRDDSGPIVDAYQKAGIGTPDPFTTIDPDTVGKLIKVAMYYARNSGKVPRPEFSGGICGEQGADPTTISMASDWGVDYVSVSPYRVCSAILASAQAKIARDDTSGPALVRLRQRNDQSERTK